MFWSGKKVLLTGHTGFKGSWLSIMLHKLGAIITGYALDPRTAGDNFLVCEVGSFVNDVRGDIRDNDKLLQVFEESMPEIVFHLAAQPLVLASYKDPRDTYETNVMGTLNVLECIRRCPSVKCAVIITTDKCYENMEQLQGYKETDRLGGYDPYSSSKACAEILVSSYRNSFYENIATARAGNVIGGGDWASDRIVPDIVKSFVQNRKMEIRNPKAVRPWQHVIEPLYGYLLLGQSLYLSGKPFAEPWNFGPDSSGHMNVWELSSLMLDKLGGGELVDCSSGDAPHETGHLSLDITKARKLLGWNPVLSINEAIEFTSKWYKLYEQVKNKSESVEAMIKLCAGQIDFYMSKAGAK